MPPSVDAARICDVNKTTLHCNVIKNSQIVIFHSKYNSLLLFLRYVGVKMFLLHFQGTKSNITIISHKKRLKSKYKVNEEFFSVVTSHYSCRGAIERAASGSNQNFQKRNHSSQIAYPNLLTLSLFIFSRFSAFTESKEMSGKIPLEVSVFLENNETLSQVEFLLIQLKLSCLFLF